MNDWSKEVEDSGGREEHLPAAVIVVIPVIIIGWTEGERRSTGHM